MHEASTRTNPLFNDSTFDQYQASLTKMTVTGTIIKSLVLLAILSGSAGIMWRNLPTMSPAEIALWFIGSALVAFIIGMFTVWNAKSAKYSAIFYAIFEGITLGAFCGLMNAEYKGLTEQALVIVIGITLAMLFLYLTRIITVTPGLYRYVLTSMCGISCVYGLVWLMNLCGLPFVYLHDSSMLSIGFSLFVVSIASYNLVLDFDFIERKVEDRSDKAMEWFAAFGLMLSLIWLFIEVAETLRKLKGRNK